MSRRSKSLLIAMSACFGLSAAGLILGMFYYLILVFFNKRSLETVLGNSIAYNEVLGGLGILGLILFFAFLFSAISDKKQENQSR